jgi:hypothetical protein
MSTSAERSEAGRRLAALKPRYLATCRVCDRTFEGTAKAVYCSTPCRVRAWRAAKRQAAPAPLHPASKLDVSLERTHALAEAEWARRDGDLAEARRWEQRARDLAAGAES